MEHAREATRAGPQPAAFTVHEFCSAHRISRALFYILLRDGRGPRLLKAGRRTLVTADAAADWRREMERATGSGPRNEPPQAKRPRL